MWSINEPQYASENNVDVEFSAHVTFLEKPSSGTLNVISFESLII
jgi:hypothetical protein